MRTLLLSLILVCFTSGAQAASILLSREFVSVADPQDPGPGDVVRLTVTATANSGEQGLLVFGQVLFSGAGAITPTGPVTQNLLVSPPNLSWTPGAPACNGSACTLFDQTGDGYAFAPVVNTPLVIGSVDFLITAPGEVFADWDPSFFLFFDAGVPAGLCVTCPMPVPEPGTAGLLALGLLGLATASRRRTH